MKVALNLVAIFTSYMLVGLLENSNVFVNTKRSDMH